MCAFPGIQAKRDALFRDKVVVKDAEDKNAEPIAVARRVVLPLPRTYAEAAEWGTRYVVWGTRLKTVVTKRQISPALLL